jgi:hypothetical protein
MRSSSNRCCRNRHPCWSRATLVQYMNPRMLARFSPCGRSALLGARRQRVLPPGVLAPGPRAVPAGLEHPRCRWDRAECATHAHARTWPERQVSPKYNRQSMISSGLDPNVKDISENLN